MENWCNAHAVLTTIVVLAIIIGVANIFISIVRMINIAKNGWPPEHLNADGEWEKKEYD